MKRILEFFSQKHIFTNFIFIAICIGGIFFWRSTRKAEMPDFTLDFVMITTAYPGASAGEVEYFVTRPIEKELKSVSGIVRVESTSSEGTSSIVIEMDEDEEAKDTVITEIRNTVYNVTLPDEVDELPKIKQFKTSRKAIIDIGIYFEDSPYLTAHKRRELQRYARTLEQRLLNLPDINSINRRGYLQEEFQILLDPHKLVSYRLPINTVMEEIKKTSVRRPAGSLESPDEERVTLDAELDTVKDFESLIVQGGFDGRFIRLSDISRIRDGFVKSTGFLKVNGREALVLNAVKNSSADIIASVDAVKKEIGFFRKSLPEGSRLRVVHLDDESRDVRNRLSIIGYNGTIGFILILVVIFLFLNFRAGFWVAMGIPFTFCFSMVVAGYLGYTINNITLAGVIIAMGMIVDDAIVVSESVMRLRGSGIPLHRAVIEGTYSVISPITASILTTIAAFLPLLAFEGRLSILTKSIPPIVAIMLAASFIESVIILPGHLHLSLPPWLKGFLSYPARLFSRGKNEESHPPAEENQVADHWFYSIEGWYSRLLARMLKHRFLIFIIFITFTAGALLLFKTEMRYALFPREETTEVFINAEAPPGTRKYKTARMAEQVENVFMPYLGKEVVGFRTYVGQKRHRGTDRENTVFLRIEILPADKREKSLKELTAEWKKEMDKIKGFNYLRFAHHRFGAPSGRPVEVLLHQDDAAIGNRAAEELAASMKKMRGIKNVEIDKPYPSPEYKLSLNNELVRKLEVSARDIGSALRTGLEGTVLYRLLMGTEEKNVKVTFPEREKGKIRSILNIPVRNREDYLVPLKSLVRVEKTPSPVEIKRLDHRRILRIYADLNNDAERTPLDIADELERDIFPNISSAYPGTFFSFDGEIKMSRESSGFFVFSIGVVLFLIYIILAMQFNSLHRPLLIMTAIIPAATSVFVVFWLHGMSTYGFFGIVGILGLAGVVVNDAVILLNRLVDGYGGFGDRISSDREIAGITSTRLRAVLLTTISTFVALVPTAYGFAGYDSMLAEMMLALAWGLVFGTLVTLVLVPALFSVERQVACRLQRGNAS
jgi:multidrug efflux pump subunit AcrB